MMDHPRLALGGMENNVGVPEELRCKRSDGKQWRCNVLSMPDKTGCEKRYIQTKKQVANSTMRASQKAKCGYLDVDADVYLESQNDDLEKAWLLSPVSLSSGSTNPLEKYRDKVAKSHALYVLEAMAVRGSLIRSSRSLNGEDKMVGVAVEENRVKSAYNLSERGCEEVWLEWTIGW